VVCFAFFQNSGDEPHHAGTRSGSQCSKAVITLSLEVILWNSQLEKIFRAIMRPLTRIYKTNSCPTQGESFMTVPLTSETSGQAKKSAATRCWGCRNQPDNP
jgi:hypothetical protein